MNEMLTEFAVIFTFIYIHGLRPSHDEDRIIDKENNECSQFYTDAYVARQSNRSLANHQAGHLGLYSNGATPILLAERMPQGTCPKKPMHMTPAMPSLCRTLVRNYT